MTLACTRKKSIGTALRQKANVMHAVILRDVRTRFFNHGLGFLVVPLWPLAHIFLLLTIYSSAGRSAPFGDSLRIFFATGLVPVLTFMYLSRFMAISLLANRPLLAFPIVKPLDVMLARASLELLGSCLMVALLVSVLLALGDDPYPTDAAQAVAAYATSIVLAIGIGMVVSVISMFFRAFLTMYFLSIMVVYLTCGVLFVPSQLPDQIAIPLSYSPVLQCVEWMRTAYYPSYNDKLLDKQYAVFFAGTAFFLGLLMERLMRHKIYE